MAVSNPKFATSPTPRNLVSVVIVGLLLSVFAGLAIHSLFRKSATFDEANHLAMGLGPLSGQGFVLNEDHPPLANLLQALPVWLFLGPEVPPASRDLYPYFRYAENLVWGGRHDGAKMIDVARLSTVFLALLLGVLVFLWGRELHGTRGGWLSLFLYCFSSEILAHSRLVTTDVAHGLGVFATLFALSRLARRISFPRTLFAGVCLGAAIGMKHTALLLVPLTFFFLFCARWRTKPGAENPVPSWKKLSFLGLQVSGIALLFVWALYGFKVGAVGEGGAVLPAPDYFLGIQRRFETMKEGRNFYLNGEISSQGWALYFPLSFLYKTPVAFLILLGLGFCTWLREFFGSSTETNHGGKIVGLRVPGVLVASTLALYLLPTMGSGMNLGLRYFLPLIPFLALFLGGLASFFFEAWGRGGRVVGFLLLGWLFGKVVLEHPDYLASFSEIVPRDRRHEFLVDSNLDWGQELRSLAAFQKEQGIERVRLGYFGTADPTAYGVVHEDLLGFLRSRSRFKGPLVLDKRGVVVVSATLLQGLYVRPGSYYERLRNLEPIAILGGGLFVFDFRDRAVEAGESS